MIEALATEEVSPQQIDRIPGKTGCYIFKGPLQEDSDQRRVLYVGKAKNLKSRVRIYFTKEGDGRAFVKFIKEKAEIIEYIIVKDEQDALILENELIKRFKPPYNISLKDDRRYLSLRLDLKHEWPRIQVTRKVKKDRAIYLGPFSSSSRLRETLNTIQKIFPLRSCPDSKLYNRSRPCIEYEIKRCVAPCVDYVSQEEYRKLVDSTVRVLQGESEELISELEQRMHAKSENEDFEAAAVLRDQITSIREVTQSENSIISLKQRSLDIDAVGLAVEGNRAAIYILFVRNGVVWDGRSFDFNQLKVDEVELLEQFIAQYYGSDVYTPHEILVPTELEVVGLDQKAKILLPRAKEKKSFLEIAEENAKAKLADRIRQNEKLGAVIESLQLKLKLKSLPEEIDCIDISHHHGTDVVASVVRFSGGSPNKSLYRKIRLKTQKIDDFESMREAVSRRYKQVSDLPDLILIDGGKGQLSAALEAVDSAGFLSQVEVISLAKARSSFEEIDPLNPKNRERVFKPGQKNPILLVQDSREELMLSFLRDEAHRFAITYHRKKKDEAMSSSVLDQVKGLGSRQKLKLLKEFDSIEAIKEAPDSELLRVINKRALANLRRALDVVED